MRSIKRQIVNFSISLLTFAVGVSLSSFWYLYTLPDTPEAYGPRERVSEELTIIGGMDACGSKENYHVYELSDGGHVSTSCQRFATAAASAQALRMTLGQAEIIERSSNLRANGQPVGETILTKKPVLRLTSWGESLCATEASSMKHLRWFERR